MTEPVIPESVALEAYRDVVQPAAREAGNTLAMVVRVTLGLPNLALRSMDETIRDTTERVLKRLEARRTEAEDVCTPVAEIAVPVIGRLRSGTLSEPLREMFLELLTSASSSTTAEVAHPAFAGIIAELSASEAALLATAARSYVPEFETFGYIDVLERDADDPRLATERLSRVTLLGLNAGEPVQEVMIDNLIRLGLIEVRQGVIALEDAYTPIENLGFVSVLREHLGARLWLRRGTIGFTSFGCIFLAACTDPTTRAKPQMPD